MSTPQAPYDFNDNFKLRAGLLLIAEIGCVSFTAIFCLLFFTLARLVRQYRQYGSLKDGNSLQPVSILFLFAIFMDSIQAFGSVLSARWAFDGKVTTGTYCTAQAALKQIGNDGVALSTMAIAVLTWTQIMHPAALSPRRGRIVTVGIISGIGVFLLLMIGIPSAVIPGYYGDSDLWCWITSETPTTKRLRIASEYGWFWLAALVAIVLYGHIVIKWYREGTGAGDRRLIRDAITMGWYPIAYFVEIMPISLIRFLEFQAVDKRPGHGWLIFASVFFAATGSINVFLWIVTGRRFGFQPVDDTTSSMDEQPHDLHENSSPNAGQPIFPPDGFETPGQVYGAIGPYHYATYEEEERH